MPPTKRIYVVTTNEVKVVGAYETAAEAKAAAAKIAPSKGPKVQPTGFGIR